MTIDARTVEFTKRMAEAMYNADTAAISHRQAPAFIFADTAVIERYCNMAQAARRIAEADTAERLDRLQDAEGELRADLIGLRALVNALVNACAGLEDIPPPLRVFLRWLSTAVEFDHQGAFDDATD